jgi:hypothetical protein
VAKLILESTNRLREQEGRVELKQERQLESTAGDYAEHLARTDKLSHEADGSDPRERAIKHGYSPCIVAENIAYQFSSAGFQNADLAREFMESWRKSPGHLKNLLDPDILEAGMAVARSSQSGKYYAVQVFGRPSTAAIKFAVVNESGTKIEYRVGEERLTLQPRVTRTHEACVASRLSFSWPEGSGNAETFEPARGDRFIVGKVQGKFRVRRQRVTNR